MNRSWRGYQISESFHFSLSKDFAIPLWTSHCGDTLAGCISSISWNRCMCLCSTEQSWDQWHRWWSFQLGMMITVKDSDLRLCLITRWHYRVAVWWVRLYLSAFSILYLASPLKPVHPLLLLRCYLPFIQLLQFSASVWTAKNLYKVSVMFWYTLQYIPISLMLFRSSLLFWCEWIMAT